MQAAPAVTTLTTAFEAHNAGMVASVPRPGSYEAEPQRLERDLATARDIQRKLLPSDFGHYRYLQVGAVNESCYAVGGDYFDVVELDGERAAFVVADVAGKGLSAALLTSLLQGGLVGLALTADPASLVRQLNRYMCARSDPNRYATAIVGEIREDGVAEYINAGHQSGLLVHNGTISEAFASQSMPIGMFPTTDFQRTSVRLEVGDTLILFSDGVVEAQNAAGEEFGKERIAAAVAANNHLPAQEMSEAILRSVAAFSEDAQPTDDMTLLVLRYTG